MNENQSLRSYCLCTDIYELQIVYLHDQWLFVMRLSKDIIIHGTE